MMFDEYRIAIDHLAPGAWVLLATHVPSGLVFSIGSDEVQKGTHGIVELDGVEIPCEVLFKLDELRQAGHLSLLFYVAEKYYRERQEQKAA